MSTTFSLGDRVSFLDDEWDAPVVAGVVVEVIPQSSRLSILYPSPEYRVKLDSGEEVIAWENELEVVA